MGAWKTIGFVAVLAAAFGVAAGAEEAPNPDYEQLVARAEAGETVDYTALRHAFVQSKDYDGYGSEMRPKFDELWPAFKAKDCAKVLAVSAEILKADYTLNAAHLVRGECLKLTGDASGAAREEAIGRGLLDSLRGSGDGKSIDTAYEVVTMAEERMLLSYLKLREVGQALIQSKGHQYDEITGRNEETGETRTVWFNVDALFLGSMRMFQKAGLGGKPADGQ
jgi:hypothetical protein